MSHRALSSLHYVCVSLSSRRGPGWDSTGLWASVDAGFPVDDNPRRDENETGIVSLRTTDANPRPRPFPYACVRVHPVPPDLPSPPPPFPPFQTPCPPNRRVAGCHSGIWGEEKKREWEKNVVGISGRRNPTRLRLVRRGCPFGWQHPLEPSLWGCLLLTCLFACLLTCLACLACPTYPPVLFPPGCLVLTRSRGILASLLVAGRRGEGRRGVAVGRGDSPRRRDPGGVPQEA